MRKIEIPIWICALAQCFALCAVLSAEEPNCEELSAMARAARAKSSVKLAAAKRKAGNSYRAQVVFAARSLELRPQDKRAAILLLSLTPQDGEQHTTWMTMGDSLCNAESFADMKSLGELEDRLPRDLTGAVLLAPEKLSSYVSYASTSVQNPHSDYAVQMQTVCRARHSEFVKAVGQLPAYKKDWFLKHVLDPDLCQALALPEAE